MEGWVRSAGLGGGLLWGETSAGRFSRSSYHCPVVATGRCGIRVLQLSFQTRIGGLKPALPLLGRVMLLSHGWLDGWATISPGYGVLVAVTFNRWPEAHPMGGSTEPPLV